MTPPAGSSDTPGIREANLSRAAAYSAGHGGLALLVSVQGRTVFEDYPNGGSPDRVNDIASGTKSFTGVLAAVAAGDGLLQLDEPVSRTIEEWRADPVKSRITIRQLLQMVSGLERGKVGRVPDQDVATHARSLNPPGERFLYSATGFQVFGAMLQRKQVAATGDVFAYFQRRVCAPAGFNVASWRRGSDGQPHLSSGASLTAREWLRFGELVRCTGRWQENQVLPAAMLDECFRGSTVNPCYGLGWWLNRPLTEPLRERMRHWTLGIEPLADDPAIPGDLVYAAGAGKQRLYVSRERGFTAVRQAGGVTEAMLKGDRGGFSDLEFLRRLLGAVQ